MSTRTEAFVNPDVLVWARETGGYSRAEAARRLGVQEVRLSSWEVGMSRPTLAQLRSIAQIYKRPVAAFFLPSVPDAEPPIHDFRKLPGKARRDLSPELRYAIRTARYRRQAALDLMEDLGEPPTELQFTASLSDDPEQVGLEAGRFLGVNGSEPESDARAWFARWRRALEERGALVMQAERVPLEEMRGFSLTDRPLGAVVLNIKDHLLARTFTMLHEFAHLALGASGVCDVVAPAGIINDPVEQFCNNVAGAVLVPREQLLEFVPPGQPDDSMIVSAAHRFGVSRETIARRLVKAGRMTDAQYRRRRAFYLAQFRQQQPKKSSGGPPRANLAVTTAGPLLSRLASEAYDEGKITASEFSDYLRVNLKHLDRIREIVRQHSAAPEPH